MAVYQQKHILTLVADLFCLRDACLGDLPPFGDGIRSFAIEGGKFFGSGRLRTSRYKATPSQGH